MKANVLALCLILATALWRVALVCQPAWFNIAPVTALAFCGAVYFRAWRLWLVPFAASARTKAPLRRITACWFEADLRRAEDFGL